MPHSFTLFTGQWADLPLEEVARLAGAPSALSFLRAFDYDPPRVAFDTAFSAGSADTWRRAQGRSGRLQTDSVDLKGLNRVGREPRPEHLAVQERVRVVRVQIAAAAGLRGPASD
jgi:hypothetical protein